MLESRLTLGINYAIMGGDVMLEFFKIRGLW